MFLDLPFTSRDSKENRKQFMIFLIDECKNVLICIILLGLFGLCMLCDNLKLQRFFFPIHFFPSVSTLPSGTLRKYIFFEVLLLSQERTPYLSITWKVACCPSSCFELVSWFYYAYDRALLQLNFC